MIAKKKLLSLIDKAIGSEEKLIGIYSANFMPWAGRMSAGRGETDFEQMFARLRNDSHRHGELLTGMRTAILEDQRDAL